MILRRMSADGERLLRHDRSSPVRGKIAAFAGAGVAAAVGATAVLSYFAVFGAMEEHELSSLNSRTVALTRQVQETDGEELEGIVDKFRADNPWYRAAVSPAEHAAFIGDPVPVDRMARSGVPANWSRIEFGDEMVSVLRDDDGTTVAVAHNRSDFAHLKSRLKATLAGIVGFGTLLAALTGSVIARATMRPVGRLRRAVDRVSTEGTLEPIDVAGSDEYAKLTESLNAMMETLNESRVRQAQLVADAGHELRTPLTSMRTNIELLIMLHRSGRVAQVPVEELDELEKDVNAQMEELSSLIGDVVDLAREDDLQKEFEPVRLDSVLAEAVTRVQRRRPDVKFRFRADPWVMDADRAALSRAPVNLLDNAAKWSPPGGVVRVSLRAAKHSAVLIIDDSGPGIPPEERDNVFERFYRAPESRSMPGSGLGLAIARQVLERHGATISIGDSDDGGARIRVLFPAAHSDHSVTTTMKDHWKR